MATVKEPMAAYDAVTLDTRSAKGARLVVAVPPGQEKTVRAALKALSRKAGVSAQKVVLDALRIAAEQTYFWTPEWQAKEQAAGQANSEGHVRTFDTMDEMIDFIYRNP